MKITVLDAATLGNDVTFDKWQALGELTVYATHSFYSFEDFKKQLSVHNRKYNNFPMRPLNWKSPADYLKAFLINGEVF